ncbi:MAG TPA: hypothetical protein PLD32_10855, partial [Saprospiraceae bacterium]|nr:hypothetical protein [Saprospiraceae bacterium]
MKKTIFLITIFILVFSLFESVPSVKAAGYSKPVNQDADNAFTFKELGYSERIMVGPYDSVRLFFSTPVNWQLTAGSKMLLKFNTS